MLQPVAITMLLSLLKPPLVSLGAVPMPLCSSFKSVYTDSEPVSEGQGQPGVGAGHGMREEDARDRQILMSQNSIRAIHPSRLNFED